MAKARPMGSWVSFISGLGIGLVCAVAVYFWRSELPVGTLMPSKSEPAVRENIAPMTGVNFEEQMDRALPKREFDFYNLLPKIELKAPGWEVSKSATDADKSTFSPGAYALQVGSFKQHKDADHAKARLALLGVLAKIHRVVINGQEVWYRLRVGPYSDLAESQAVRAKLIEADSDFILLKLGEPAG